MTFFPSYVTVCVASGSVQCIFSPGLIDLYFVLYPLQSSWLTGFGFTDLTAWLAATVAGRITEA
jgi:hypothetical protein